jgi:hypothetical protein
MTRWRYDHETEVIYPADATPAEFIARAEPDSGPLMARAPELRDEREALCVLLEAAWGVIANAHSGYWREAPLEWQRAAEKWRDAYFATIGPLVESKPYQCSFDGCDGSSVEGRPHTVACNLAARDEGQTICG